MVSKSNKKPESQKSKAGTASNSKKTERTKKTVSEPEMLNPDTKLYIISYTKFLKPKLVNKTSSLETNEHN